MPDTFENRHPLFLKGGDVAADSAKYFRPLLASKGSGYLLLEFDHADDPFSIVIGKRNSEVVHERQHSIPILHPIQQVLRLALLDPPFFLRFVWGRWRWRRIFRMAQLDDLLIPFFEVGDVFRQQGLSSIAFCLLYGTLDLIQELDHPLRPLLVVVFDDAISFPMMMGVA